MSSDNINTYNIQDELCRKTGLGLTAKWITGDVLSVTAYNHIKCTQQNLDVQDYAINVHHLHKEFIFNEPILRSLIAESNSIFLTLQKMKQKGNTSDYLNISRSYRSTVRACLEKLTDLVMNEENDDDKTKYENYITIFYNIECVWHICEILLIDPAPSNIIVQQLLEWIRFHFPAPQRIAAALFQYGREANKNPDYWSAVKGLILQGQISIVRPLLHLHSSSDSISFQAADQILKEMPIFTPYSGLSLQTFKSKFQNWVTETDYKINAGILDSQPDLEDVIKLATGNLTTWRKQAKESSCWYEYLPGLLNYTEPGCKHFELGKFAKGWMENWKMAKGLKDSGLNFLDRVILSVMENDMSQVLHDLQNMNDNQWFVAHITDLLHHCGQLKVLSSEMNEIELRDSLLFDFGTTLMSRDSLWIFGLDYLEFSSKEGPAAMELLLTKIPIKTEKQAQKIIAVARSKGLISVETEICRVMAARSLLENRNGNALEWALRSQDYILVTGIANTFLDHYYRTGEMLCPDLLANIGPKMLGSPRLVFLAKYFEFHQLYIDREFGLAGELLVNMLDSLPQLTPDYFWPVLLADSIALLESKDPIIPAKGTYVIMHYLESQLIPLIEKKKKQMDNENMDMEVDVETFKNVLQLKCGTSSNKVDNIEELVKLIRLACARNLARALIIENTVIPSYETFC